MHLTDEEQQAADMARVRRELHAAAEKCAPKRAVVVHEKNEAFADFASKVMRSKNHLMRSFVNYKVPSKRNT